MPESDGARRSERTGAEDGSSVAQGTVVLRLGDELLRPWRTSDAAALHDACQDPEIARSARGRGIGARALHSVADWTFEATDVVRIDAYIMVGNEMSERMTRRAGSRREGVLRSWDLRRGRAVDCVSYSRLRSDA